MQTCKPSISMREIDALMQYCTIVILYVTHALHMLCRSTALAAYTGPARPALDCACLEEYSKTIKHQANTTCAQRMST